MIEPSVKMRSGIGKVSRAAQQRFLQVTSSFTVNRPVAAKSGQHGRVWISPDREFLRVYTANRDQRKEVVETAYYQTPGDNQPRLNSVLGYADLEQSGERSKIDLRVQLAPVLETVISSIENHFAFAAKSRIHANGFTEVSFKPPSSYPTLDEMTVLMRVRENEGLDLHFHCRIRTFNRAAGKGLKARTVKLEHNYPRSKYLIYNSQPNRELFRSVIEEVLAKATPGKVSKG